MGESLSDESTGLRSWHVSHSSRYQCWQRPGRFSGGDDVQRDFESLEECNQVTSRLRFAAERIDPAAYREVAMALVAVDAPIGAAARLANAIASARGQECRRDFIGEYAQLTWEHITESLPLRGAE
jgi:hypothetical protein